MSSGVSMDIVMSPMVSVRGGVNLKGSSAMWIDFAYKVSRSVAVPTSLFEPHLLKRESVGCCVR